MGIFMSANLKTFINFDRYEQDKHGKKIPVWRKRVMVLTKEQVTRAKELKEKLSINVDA